MKVMPSSRMAPVCYSLGVVLGAAFLFVKDMSSKAYASDWREAEVSKILTSINAPADLEPAGSHGLSGFSLGVGAVATPPLSSLNIDAHGEPQDGSTSGEKILIPSLWITKGLIWPLDIGASFGTNDGEKLKRMSGYVQLTIYQDFARPAIAVRGHYGRIIAPESIEAATVSGQLVVSWGYGPITAFGGAGMQQTEAQVKGDSINAFGLSPDENLESTRIIRPWRDHFYYGLQVQVPSSLLVLAAQMTEAAEDQRVLSAKLSMAM